MAAPAPGPYAEVDRHELASEIIRGHSTNREDVRDVALRGVDLARVRRVLDLGCGFGFLTETLARRLAPGAHFRGLDRWPADAAPFVARATRHGHVAAFDCVEVGCTLPYPDRSFDLVVCSYALYFFPGAIPDVARILAPDGLFVAITHRARSAAGELEAAGLPDAARRLRRLVEAFSAENGAALLAPHFARVERVDYSNTLRFERRDRAELLEYLRFKLPFLDPGETDRGPLPERLVSYLDRRLARDGRIELAKDDAVLRCRGPR